MALPGSGPISIGQVASEFGRANNMGALYGVASGIPGSGAISLGMFYGKSNIFKATLAGGAGVYLRNWLIDQGWNQSAPAEVTITGWCWALHPGQYALHIEGSFPGGLTVINNSAIIGGGGGGGHGRSADSLYNGNRYFVRAHGPINAQAGGPALYVTTPVTFYNYGNILGGGGGGGGGGSGNVEEWESHVFIGGGGGGGGASNASAYGGAGGYFNVANGDDINYVGQPGGAGGSGALGAGGNPAAAQGAVYGGAGGRGGDWGAAGVAGSSAYGGSVGTADPSSAAAGGAAINGNGWITWGATGLRLGSIN